MARFDESQRDSIARTKVLHWILWWRLSEDEIVAQVLGYDALAFWQSARGLSSLLLAVAAAATSLVTVIAVGIDDSEPLDYLPAAICAILAVLVWSGNRWAILAAMVFWTVDRALQPLMSGRIELLILAVLWWAVYMHVFWLAFRTETVHRTLAADPVTTAS